MIVLYNFNNQYVPIRERIFYQMKSKSISQKEFAKILGVEAPTVTDWKTGRSYSFMKKLKPIADALETTESWLLNGVTEIVSIDGPLGPKESLEELFDSAKNFSISMLQQLRDDIDRDPELLEKLSTVPCAMDIFIKIYEYGKWYFEPTVKISTESKEKAPSPATDESEERLLTLYRKLNEEGRDKLLDYADDLAESGKYKKVSALRVGTKEV